MASPISRSPSATSVRADAISRLKRAASLPRMKDGRRPAIPAHGGAFSEGGRSEESSQRGTETPVYGNGDTTQSEIDLATLDTSREGDADVGQNSALAPAPATDLTTEDDLLTPMPREGMSGLQHPPMEDVSFPEPVEDVEPVEVEPVPAPAARPRVSLQVQTDQAQHHSQPEQQEQPPIQLSPVQQQQLLVQLQLQALAANGVFGPSVFPPSAFPAGLPPSAFLQNAFQPALGSPQLQSPHDILLSTLLNQQQQQQQQQQRQQVLPPPQPRAYIPPTSPVGWQTPIKSPASPLPSLNDLAAAHQRGLFRSNSAAARTEAYSKLTGGRETPMVSPPPSVLGHASTSRLGRSNTVTGGERLAAGGRMVHTIKRRQQQEDPNRAPSALDMTTSAGEESSVSVGQREERRSRRRRRHSSQSKPVVDDRDVPTNTPGTPAMSATPLPPEDIPPLPRPESLSSTSAAHALRQSMEKRSGRDNLDFDYMEAKRRPETPGYMSKPATDIDTDYETIGRQPSPAHRPESEVVPMLPLPATPSLSGSPAQNPQFLTPESGLPATEEGLNGIPVYLTTASMNFGRDSFPQTVTGTPYSPFQKSPQHVGNGDASHGGEISGYDSTAESPWNLGAGAEFQGSIGDAIGRNLMDQIGSMGEDDINGSPEEGQVAFVPPPDSPVPDSAATLMPRMDATPSPLPPMPATAPAALNASEPAWPTNAVGKSPSLRPVQRDIVSEASYTSFPPASSHRSRTESIGLSDLETAITDGETTGREDRPKKRRSGSNFSDKVKQFLSHMSSKSALRQRTTSTTSSRQERMERSQSNHSSDLLAQKFEPWESMEKEGERISKERMEYLEIREMAERRNSKEKQLPQPRDGPLSKSVSSVSLPAQASPVSGKSLMDVTTPLPQGSVSPMPPPSAEQIARYNSDKLLPFPGMLRLEQERSKFRALSPPTSPTTPSFSPPPTSLSPPLDSQSTVKASSVKLGTPSPGMTLLDLPATPDSAPATPGTLGERMGDRTLHYIDLGDNLLAGSEPLPTTRRGVQQWLRMKKPSLTNGGVQKKSSLTDLLNSGMLAEGGAEKDDPATFLGKLSLARSLNKKPSRPRLQEKQDSRPSTAPSIEVQPPVPAASTSVPLSAPPQIPLPPPPKSSPPETPPASLTSAPPDPPVLVVASATTTSNSLASLAAAAAIFEEKSNGNSALAALAAAAAVSDQPGGSHSSVGSDPSGPNSQTTDVSGSALSTPSVSQETSSASQPSLDSPPLPQEPRLKDWKPASTVPANPIPVAAQTPPLSFSPKPSPPRKLLLHSPVLQVVPGDRLKERHLFLFSDILVIAKPDPRSSANEKQDPRSLSRPLVVKSVVELRNLFIKPQQDQNEPARFDKHKSTMRAFADEFAEDPVSAVDRLAQQLGIQDDPRAIAGVLFETPSLDKRQLGEYLSLRPSRHILRAFIDRFGFEDVRIDIALRTFMLSLILPENEDSADHLLNTFAARWWSANSRTIGFDRELSTRLVLAMLQLSDALHSSTTYSSPGRSGAMSPSRPRITSQDWIDTFRIRDPRQLVPELLLRAIYTGISRFRIAEALDSNSDSEMPAAMIPARMKTRLTHGEPSERIHIRIPRPDRNFAIRLYGHGLKFDPEYLDFSNSTEQSFVIFPTTVGQKTIIFGREGVNSAFYTGVPLSKTVLVERAFMKNTFQLAFINHLGNKRKYLFSMDDLFRLTEWTNTLTREITKRRSSEPVGQSKEAERKAAAEVIAFVTLRDALLPREEKEPNSSAADTSAASLSRNAASRPTTPKEVQDRDKLYSGQQIIQMCIQNSLLPGMILRAKPARAEGLSEPGKRTPTPRGASPMVMTPRARPIGMNMI